MDGTRKTPPGSEARNLSRRDGIRAGSVSGPWRSMPKAAGEASGAPETRDSPAATSGSPLDWTGRKTPQPVERETELAEIRPVEHPERTPDHAPRADPAHRDAVPLRGTRGLAGWIVFGVGVAVALVAAAFYLGPGAPLPAVAPEQTQSPAAATDPAPLAGNEAPAPVAAPAGIVRLRVGPDADPSVVARLSEALEAEGLGSVRVETLPFSITQSRVGYYRTEDQRAAEALAALVEPLIGKGDVAIRDYGDLLDDTEPGRLDLWLGD